MRKWNDKELENKLDSLRELIQQYQEWAENSYINNETRTDIYRAGLKELDEEIYFMLAEN